MNTRASISPVVREISCKTTLNRSSLGAYSMNCYVGCQHGCAYCYARYMQRFHPHEEAWGAFVDVKTNAPEALARQVRRMPPGSVFVSSACDAWQPLETQRRLTRECCRILLDHGFAVHALTKSDLIRRDFDLFADHNARVATTITTLDPAVARLWEAAAGPVERRIALLRAAREAGIQTGIMFGPLLPFLSDSADSLNALFECAAELRVDVLWVDALNPRPKVWESVQSLLRKHYPDLVDRYARVLFSPVVRNAYLAALGERIAAAARRHRLERKLHSCI